MNHCYVFFETKLENNVQELYLGDQYLEDPDTNTYNSLAIQLGPLAAGWHHYQLYVDLQQQVAILAIDDVAGGTYKLQPQVVAAPFVAARIGVTYQGGGSSINEVYDNVGLSEFP